MTRPGCNLGLLNEGKSVPCSLADSYVHLTANEAGAAAEFDAARKVVKYITLPTCYTFQPVAVESLSPINTSAVDLLCSLG